ncbi:TPA: hypothetical protein N0F65_007946 [Lagenidium giganteum]|uniref:Arrestin-like N-terminal domain-containing protein n=1 Tax=Lagenidium giganteum TaxID=4803 RepID=A0AAV2YI63_9STRA|nr:TPA: hypothetical protein N0F65_007946 [Lagenidium giganteum]
MGKHSKNFGIATKGSICLKLAQQQYTAGDVVTGSITVNVSEIIRCDALVLKVSGKERMAWKEAVQQHRGDGHERTVFETHGQHKAFFEHTLVVRAVPQAFVPGNYTYTFEFRLPDELPATFAIDSFPDESIKNLMARIEYKLKATLEMNGFFASDFKSSCPVMMHAQSSASQLEPSKQTVAKDIRLLCCWKKGTCELSGATDKSVYKPSDTARIQCSLDNRSRVAVTQVRAVLWQDLEIQLGDDKTLRCSRQISRHAHGGVLAGASQQQTYTMPLARTPKMRPLQASTEGKSIKCSYRIVVECDFAWCRDLRVQLPISILG